ncbi:MAG: GNAT family N-acetyltransferase [Parvibaculaceae bacterium]
MNKPEAQPVSIRVHGSLADVDAREWDACANPSGQPFNPFVSHAFLSALEESESATAETGWLPRHLTVEDGCGRIVGAAPCYLKSHSQGEYVFDYGWADAYHRAGGRYYPKLQISVPFTPVPGRRLLVRDGADEALVRNQLATGAVEVARRLEASSVHLTFIDEPAWHALGQDGWLQRTDTQFHWQNAGHSTFDDFLGALASRKRKMIRKEREAVRRAGIEHEWVTGSDLKERHWDHFFDFYMDTGSRKWGSPYLSRKFFSLIGEKLAEHILLVMAKRNGRMIAGALNFIGSDALYGRNWGALEHHEFLHFETCYYQAIEFAIARGLSRVEAGAQGAHKLARGYLPTTTRSLHYLADPRLSRAVADYLEHERHEVERDSRFLADHSPYRHMDEEEGAF